MQIRHIKSSINGTCTCVATTGQNYGNKYILAFLCCTKAFEQSTRLNDMTLARFGTCIRTLIVAVLIPYGRQGSGGSESWSWSSLYPDSNFHRALSSFISIFLSRLFQRLYMPLKTKVAYTLWKFWQFLVYKAALMIDRSYHMLACRKMFYAKWQCPDAGLPASEARVFYPWQQLELLLHDWSRSSNSTCWRSSGYQRGQHTQCRLYKWYRRRGCRRLPRPTPRQW